MNTEIERIDISSENTREMGKFNTDHCEFCKDEIRFSSGSWKELSGFPEVIHKSLEFGRLRGVASIAVCANSELKDSLFYSGLIKELIQRDILVTLNGCAAEMIQAALDEADTLKWTGEGLLEFCNFVGISPFNYMDSSDTLDLFNFLADHLGVTIAEIPVAAVTAQQNGDSILKGCKLLTPGNDPVEAADLIDDYIHDRREELKWHDRCGSRFTEFSC